jgi:hypothetical protein
MRFGSWIDVMVFLVVIGSLAAFMARSLFGYRSLFSSRQSSAGKLFRVLQKLHGLDVVSALEVGEGEDGPVVVLQVSDTCNLTIEHVKSPVMFYYVELTLDDELVSDDTVKEQYLDMIYKVMRPLERTTRAMRAAKKKAIRLEENQRITAQAVQLQQQRAQLISLVEESQLMVDTEANEEA